MKRRKSADASERIRQLQERVKAGNLPYFDPLADGRALEYDRALAHHYGGFKARAHPSRHGSVRVQGSRAALFASRGGDGGTTGARIQRRGVIDSETARGRGRARARPTSVHRPTRLSRCSLRRVLCVELLRLLHGGDGVLFARV